MREKTRGWLLLVLLTVGDTWADVGRRGRDRTKNAFNEAEEVDTAYHNAQACGINYDVAKPVAEASGHAHN